MVLAQQIMAQVGESTGHARPEAWAETLRKEWETMAPLYAQSKSVMFDKFIPQTITYVVFSEQALKIIQTIQDAGNDADWREDLQRGFDAIRSTFFQPFQARDATHPGLAAFWGLPLDAWQRVAFSLSLPEDEPQAPGKILVSVGGSSNSRNGPSRVESYGWTTKGLTKNTPTCFARRLCAPWSYFRIS